MRRRYLEKHVYTDKVGNILPYGKLVDVLADEIGDYDVAAQHEDGIMLCTFEDFVIGLRYFGQAGVGHDGSEESMLVVEQAFRKIDLQENFLFLTQEYDPQQLGNDEISCSRVDTIQRKKKGKDVLGWGMN